MVKAKFVHVVFVMSIILLLCSTVTCSTSSSSEKTTEMKLIDELWDALISYNTELAVAEQIMKDSMNEVEQGVRDGKVTMVEFRKRIFQIILIHANTIKFLDNKPEYGLLNSFMWGEEGVPRLAWAIPEEQEDREKRS